MDLELGERFHYGLSVGKSRRSVDQIKVLESFVFFRLHRYYSFLFTAGVTEAMGGNIRQPKLPRRSVIEKFTKSGAECIPEMMTWLTCVKDANFNESKCASQMLQLSECVSRQVNAQRTHKPTTMYHLKRLYYMQRRH